METALFLLPSHFEIDEAAEGDEGVIREETPGEHGPESVAGAKVGKDEIERTFRGAGVAWGRNEGDRSLDC